MLVGYCLGDSLGRSPDPHRARLVAGTPSMLFLAGVEGVLRASVREQLTGRPADLPDLCWHATARWADRTNRGQLAGVVARRDAAEGAPWPDGWLSELTLLRGGRGSAPAVEEALGLGADLDPRPGHAPSDSVGDLSIPRTLPVALLAVLRPDEDGLRLAERARDVAAYSHGLVAQVLAVALTRTVAQTLVTGTPQPLVELADLSAVYQGVPHTDDVVRARVALRAVADQLPPDPHPEAAEVGHGIPSGTRTALGALTVGLGLALTHPGRTEVGAAVDEILRAPHPSAAAVALAVLGAAHGLEALPADAVARLDVGHVADQLAADLLLQVDGAPLRSPDTAVTDGWLRRYPPS